MCELGAGYSGLSGLALAKLNLSLGYFNNNILITDGQEDCCLKLE